MLHVVLSITVTVVVGFLYILNVCLLSVFVIVRSRKFILLLTSVSKVKFNIGYTLMRSKQLFTKIICFPYISEPYFKHIITPSITSFHVPLNPHVVLAIKLVDYCHHLENAFCS